MITITLSRADLEILEDVVWNAYMDARATVKEYEDKNDLFMADQYREHRITLRNMDQLLMDAMYEYDEKMKRGEQND